MINVSEKINWVIILKFNFSILTDLTLKSKFKFLTFFSKIELCETFSIM